MPRIAAVQLDAVPGDVAQNLARCERLADDAARRGAEIIVLPEFFTTAAGFLPQLADAALPPDGAAAQLLHTLARRHSALVAGSFLCRDPDGQTRNAFLLATPEGIAGRHDKDLPTMWESCFYVGGADDGVLDPVRVDDGTAFTPGAAVCWEFMRTQSVHRMRGRVDVVLGGSCWWSIPPWPPRGLTRRWEGDNAATAARIAPALARLVGAPVAHAAHCGELDCRLPMTPFTYRGHFEGGAMIVDAGGHVLARRERSEGAGFVVADVKIGRVRPQGGPPAGFWLHERGPLPTLFWTWQNWHGRRWYTRHVAGRQPIGARGAVPARPT